MVQAAIYGSHSAEPTSSISLGYQRTTSAHRMRGTVDRGVAIMGNNVFKSSALAEPSFAQNTPSLSLKPRYPSIITKYRNLNMSQPPFPDDVPTAPLLRLSLAKLQARDTDEIQRFIRACEDIGFFYLDLTGPGDEIIGQANQLFDVGKDLFELPLDEKMKYNFQDQKTYFGYKHMGAEIADTNGNLDKNEFYNASLPNMASIRGMLMRSRLAKMTSSKSARNGQPRTFLKISDLYSKDSCLPRTIL